MNIFRTTVLLFVVAQSFLRAQAPPQISPAAAAQLVMQPSPPADGPPVEVTASAEFDPPVAGVGEKTYYRVQINATQNIIRWPDEISAPPELGLGPGARGGLTLQDGVKAPPLTAFTYEVTPTATGHFTVPEFLVDAGWLPVTVPAASLEVVATNTGTLPPKIRLEVMATNLFFGEPFQVRLIMPLDAANRALFFRDVQFNGASLLADRMSSRVQIAPVDFGGQLREASTYETVVTPLAAGQVTISAQAFTTSGPGPLAVYKFMVSDPVVIFVRPLPAENELPGFTGAMGKFLADAPQLSTNRLRVGEPVKLKYNFHGEGNLTRYVPPETPRSHEWQIFAGKTDENIFTFIPLTDEVTSTPAIPFAAFDPATGNYQDLTIPAMPVTVTGDGLPVQITDWNSGDTNAVMLKLSAMTKIPGKFASSLRPPQMRAGLVLTQILPVLLFVLLWWWDEHKRFLEAHPEIMRRRKAKRDLRREKGLWQQAVAQGDAEGFVAHAAEAMRIGVAPHFPAESRAMVCGDVLSRLEGDERDGETGATVRKVFAAADAKFSGSKAPPGDFLALKPGVESVLQKLEERL